MKNNVYFDSINLLHFGIFFLAFIVFENLDLKFLFYSNLKMLCERFSYCHFLGKYYTFLLKLIKIDL